MQQTHLTGSAVVENPLTYNTTYTIDSGDQTISALDADGYTQSATYSANQDPMTYKDKATNITMLAYDNNNDLMKITSPTGAAENATYNVAAQTGGTSIPGYQYLPSKTTDAQTDPTSYLYNPHGQVATTTYPLKLLPTLTTATLTYHYQGDSGISCSALPGELCSSVDGNGNTTTYTYNATVPLSGDLIGITPPAPLGAETITLDSLGRLSKVVDGRGVTTTYGYDNMDRITFIRTDGLTANACTTTDAAAGKCLAYTYDEDGNLINRLDVTGYYTFGYDTLGRPTSKTIGTTVTSVTYDGASNIATYTDADGTVTYGYDHANELTSLALPGGSCTGTISLCTTFVNNADGSRDHATYPSGAINTEAYDTSNRQTNVIARYASGVVYADRVYTYTAGSNDTSLIQTAEDQTSTTTTYGYDASNRLLTATPTSGSTYTYTYDAAGNRLTAAKSGTSTMNFSFNNANELCYWGTTAVTQSGSSCPTTPGGDHGYASDGAGNQTTSSSTTNTYNNLGQLSSNTIGTTTTNYTYADVGMSERTSYGSTSYINGLLLGVTQQTTGSTTLNFVRDPSGNLFAMKIGSGTWNYYTLDANGSVIAMDNSAGTTPATALYTYDPFGQVITQSGTLDTTNPYGYAGGQVDSTNIEHFGQRYDNNGLGAWQTQDPLDQIGSPGQNNRFVYSGDNPTTYEDADGAGFLSGLADFVDDLTTAQSLQQAVTDLPSTTDLLKDAAGAVAGSLFELGCNAALGLADVPTVGAATAVGEIGCTLGSTYFGSQVSDAL